MDSSKASDGERSINPWVNTLFVNPTDLVSMASSGNDGKGGSKRKRHVAKYLNHAGRKSTISAGLQGFLVTCVGGRERQSIREAINILEEFYDNPTLKIPLEDFCSGALSGLGNPDDELTSAKNESVTDRSDSDGSEQSRDAPLAANKCPRLDSNSGEDTSQAEPRTTERSSLCFDELLATEIKELRDPKKARFTGYETGCHGIIFIRMHKSDKLSQVSPVKLAEAIVRDAAMSRNSRSRYCMRLLPVETTCYASVAEVRKAVEPLLLHHFRTGPDQQPHTFAVVCEVRANTNLNKMEFINVVAKLVPEPHTVHLSKPNKTILVQIVKTACTIGVVDDFKELSKYNLRQLTRPT